MVNVLKFQKLLLIFFVLLSELELRIAVSLPGIEFIIGHVFSLPLWASVYLCLVVTCLERADLLALVCGVKLCVCYFPIGILCQVCYLMVSICDLCTLTLSE